MERRKVWRFPYKKRGKELFIKRYVCSIEVQAEHGFRIIIISRIFSTPSQFTLGGILWNYRPISVSSWKEKFGYKLRFCSLRTYIKRTKALPDILSLCSIYFWRVMDSLDPIFILFMRQWQIQCWELFLDYYLWNTDFRCCIIVEAANMFTHLLKIE